MVLTSIFQPNSPTLVTQRKRLPTSARLPALCLSIIDDLIPVDLLRPQTAGQRAQRAQRAMFCNGRNQESGPGPGQDAIWYAHVLAQMEPLGGGAQLADQAAVLVQNVFNK